MARAAAADAGLFRPTQSLEGAIAKLRSLRGIGEWTAQYIAMRVLREPDAFPAADIGLMRALTPRAVRGPRLAKSLLERRPGDRGEPMRLNTSGQAMRRQ